MFFWEILQIKGQFASWGMGLTTLGLFIFIFINDNPLWAIVANLVLLGIGSSLFTVPNNITVMGSVEKEYYGVAALILGTMRLVGGAVSMAVVTLMQSIYVGNSSLMLAAALRTSYIVFTVICLAGIFSVLAAKVDTKGGSVCHE